VDGRNKLSRHPDVPAHPAIRHQAAAFIQTVPLRGNDKQQAADRGRRIRVWPAAAPDPRPRPAQLQSGLWALRARAPNKCLLLDS